MSTLSGKWRGLIGGGEYRIRSAYEDAASEVAIVTLDELILAFGIPSFIKIDVEGYETMVIKGLSHKIPMLVFEANLPEFMAETMACVKQLSAIDPEAIFNYSSSFGPGLDRSVSCDTFLEVLEGIEDRSIDVICLMSNFPEYYDDATFFSESTGPGTV